MKKTWLLLLILVAVFGFSGVATAVPLEVIGTATYNENVYNLIYEEAQQLVWLDYSNLDYSNAVDSFKVNWQGQMDWAIGLNNQGVLVYNLDTAYNVTWDGDWRLPKTVDGPWENGYDGTTTGGYNITSSEMGHLYYKSLENLGYYDTNGLYVGDGNWGLKNTNPFNNLLAADYWSGTVYSTRPNPHEDPSAWYFYFDFGSQGYGGAAAGRYALAVRPVQVPGTAAPVPEPATIILLGTGLLGFLGASWNKFKKNKHPSSRPRNIFIWTLHPPRGGALLVSVLAYNTAAPNGTTMLSPPRWPKMVYAA